MGKRINVMVSDMLNTKLDIYSERYGVSKSSIVGFVLGQWMDNVERTNEAVYGSLNNKGFLHQVFENINNEVDKEVNSDEEQ